MDPFKLGHRKSLDGLRGLAIILVLLSHVPTLPLQGGFVGVDLFFVLSGFLITSLLLEEWQTAGSISLKAFYARRALRLLPALAAMLGVVVAASAMLEPPGEAAAMRKGALIALLYSANWFMAYGTFPREHLSPTWSLSVEEQFYVVWPVVLLLLLRGGLSKRAMAGITAAGLLASAGARAWLARTPGFEARVYFGSDTHADGLLAGALAAMVASWGLLPRTPSKAGGLNAVAVVVLAYLGLVAWRGWAFDRIFLQAGYLLLNLGTAALTACLVSCPWPPLRLLFEFAPLAWIGKISYGLYLWHLAVFWGLSRSNVRLGSWYWEVAIALTVGCAAVSFYALERPLLRFKRRFERVGSGAVPPP